MNVTIIGICLDNRLEASVEFQKIISKFGCQIRTRLGLHPSKDIVCLNRGVILLEASGDVELLVKELSMKWEVQKMEFEL